MKGFIFALSDYIGEGDKYVIEEIFICNEMKFELRMTTQNFVKNSSPELNRKRLLPIFFNKMRNYVISALASAEKAGKVKVGWKFEPSAFDYQSIDPSIEDSEHTGLTKKMITTLLSDND